MAVTAENALDVLAKPETEKLHRKWEDLTLKVRQFQIWVYYFSTPEDAALIRRTEKEYNEAIRQLVEQETALLNQLKS